jgi:hypothetical protein
MIITEVTDTKKPTLIDALEDFLPFVAEHLGLDDLPKIHLHKNITNGDTPTFGQIEDDGESQEVNLAIDGRHPIDILRTLAHELVHYRQMKEGKITDDSGQTGSDEENEANAEAGVIMRNFNGKFPRYLRADPVICP